MYLEDFTFKTCNVLDEPLIVITHFPATSDAAFHITLTAICVILTFTGICLNACTVLTIWKTPILKEKLSNFIIMMQSTIDLLIATLVIPLFTYLLLSEITGSGICLLFYIQTRIGSLMFMASLTTFSALNYERYMGICHPVYHRCRMKKSHLLNYVVAMFALEILVVSSNIYLKGKVTRYVMGLLCIAFLAHTIFVYGKAARVIQIKFRVSANQRGSNGRSKSMQYFREIKATKSCFLVVICCIICNLPVILTVSKIINIDSVSTNAILSRWFIALAMLNSSLNSIILFWKNKRLRIHAKNIWKCS